MQLNEGQDAAGAGRCVAPQTAFADCVRGKDEDAWLRGGLRSKVLPRGPEERAINAG
jgi:hypothetical protein